MYTHILVTGGAGYIGSTIVNDLQGNENYKVTVFDDFSTGQKSVLSDKVSISDGNITNVKELNTVFAATKFDVVIHCAGKKSVREGEENPSKYFYNNVLGTLNILHCMELFRVPHIIFSSTAAVYSSQNKGVSDEYSDVRPSSVYGQSKLICEQLINSFFTTGKIKTYQILRYFNVAGDSGLKFQENSAENVFPLLAKALKSGQPFYIFGTDYDTKDGTGVRDYVHVSDISAAHLLCLVCSESGIFNLGTEKGYSVRELVEKFNILSNEEIKVHEKDRRTGDCASVLADPTKAKKVLQWKSKKNLDDMVLSTLKTYR